MHNEKTITTFELKTVASNTCNWEQNSFLSPRNLVALWFITTDETALEFTSTDETALGFTTTDETALGFTTTDETALGFTTTN